jgi:hypothetical protein
MSEPAVDSSRERGSFDRLRGEIEYARLRQQAQDAARTPTADSLDRQRTAPGIHEQEFVAGLDRIRRRQQTLYAPDDSPPDAA